MTKNASLTKEQERSRPMTIETQTRRVCFFLSILLAAHCSVVEAVPLPADTVRFTGSELLGRPTGVSIAVTLCAEKDIDAYIELGTQQSVYTQHSAILSYPGGKPFTVQVSGLLPNTKYYYRVRYRSAGAADFIERNEHAFTTARPKANQVVFAIEADPHMDESTSPVLYKRTLSNVMASNPDFLIDLGDTFMAEKLQNKTQDSVLIRYLMLRSLFESVCHSIPLYLVNGNHEGELGWLLDGTSTNLAVMTSVMRLQYFPNPIPDGFYTGDTTSVKYVGQRQNYYAWESGNALFVVLDPYWYTAKKPGTTKNNWDWTLGRVQYDWLKRTLENSTADFKFVFSHQVVGGDDTEGRGGIEAVPYFEMGGLNVDGTPGFAANRPGWPMPIHQLMVANNVSAFFHGHDHVYVKQEMDGIIYQELPQPGFYNVTSPEKSYSNISLAAKYGYTHGDILSSSGFLRVTVKDTAAVVDYIRTYLPEHENALQQNGSNAFSYSIRRANRATVVRDGTAACEQFSLRQNFPNPFNPQTQFEFQTPNAGKVNLTIFDVLGRVIAVLVDEEKPAGVHRIQWDASRAPSGIYFYRLTARNFTETKRMSVVK